MCLRTHRLLQQNGLLRCLFFVLVDGFHGRRRGSGALRGNVGGDVRDRDYVCDGCCCRIPCFVGVWAIWVRGGRGLGAFFLVTSGEDGNRGTI